jgi:sec-independent protein translocase protein TatC
MTLIEHLEELRSRIFRVGIAFVVVAIAAGFFVEYIFYWLLRPSGLTELAFLGPVLIYQAWMFVAPAVGEVGRISTYVLVTLSSALFLGGVAFGYYLVLPTGLHFLLGYAPDRYEEVITADTYLPFVTRFLLAFGLIFELPAATLVGARLGLITAPMLKRYWRHALVVGAVLAAALTPGQDPFSMIFMALPLYLMYGLSIVIARFVNPVVPHEEALEASPLSDRLAAEDGDEGDENHTGERDL